MSGLVPKQLLADQIPVEPKDAVVAVAEWAQDIAFSLAAIQQNTGQVFFWTLFMAISIIAIFFLRVMHALLGQLVQLNNHQETYRAMWQEEREDTRRQDQHHRLYLYQQMRDRNDSLASAVREGHLPRKGERGWEDLVRVTQLLGRQVGSSSESRTRSNRTYN